MEMLSIQSMVPYKSRLKAYIVLKALAKRKLASEDKELLELIIAEQLELIKEYALKHSKDLGYDED